MKKMKWMTLFAVVNLAFLAVTAICLYLFLTPCRLETDCRGYGVDTERLKQWEEQEKDVGQGILQLTGWKVGTREEILAVSTGRRETAQLLGVYGSMEQVFSADLLSGTWGLTGREDACVLSRELAEALFGCTEVTGEQIRLEVPAWAAENESQGGGECPPSAERTEKEKKKQVFEVAGVADQEGEYLLFPLPEGTVETVAVLFEKRYQVKETMKELAAAGSGKTTSP